MSYYEYKKQVDALSERDRKIWDLHRKATNALAFAEQMAAQEAVNSQCKYEKQADDATEKLFQLLMRSL